jgi:FecR-like protein
MTDDYLWDGSGSPDPEVQRLEQMLGRLRYSQPPLAQSGLDEGGPSMRARWRAIVPLLATAAMVALAVGLTWRATRTPPSASSWEVASLTGQPRIGGQAVAQIGRLAIGQTLTTDAASRARIHVSTIGDVTVDADTRVRLVATRADRHQLALERGTLHASITAPPGQFVVDTSSATATDLGCIYTLHVDERGAGQLSVEVGWVAFELNGRESFVPAGASCPMDPIAGPGTPSFDNADPELRQGLERFDFGRGADRAEGLRLVLAHARKDDAMTLWHLLARVAPAERADVYDALAARVPPPDGVTRNAVLKLDPNALDRWWNELELGDVSFWRTWKRPVPSTAPGR